MVQKFLRTSLIIAGIGCFFRSSISDGHAADDGETHFKPGRPTIVYNDRGCPWDVQTTRDGEHVAVKQHLFSEEDPRGAWQRLFPSAAEVPPSDERIEMSKADRK